MLFKNLHFLGSSNKHYFVYSWRSVCLLITLRRRHYLSLLYALYNLGGIELIGTLVLSSNKTLATIKLLVYFQLVIVGFKLDGMVGVDWSQVLTGFGILLAFIIMVASALIIYSMIGGLACLNSPFFAIRRRGAIFTYLNLLSVCCLIGSILWNVYINDNCGHILIAGALFSWISIIFTFPNIAEITLCFCKI